MNDLTRRHALQLAAAGGAMAILHPGLASPQESASSPPALKPSTRADGKSGAGGRAMDAKAVQTDRDFVIAAGMTEAEADCWETIARAAGQFFDLPEQHPMDAQEMASAIHIVQNKLLSRPTYRKYLELAKAAYDQKQKKPDE